jgi:aspartate dehydrogenase
MRIGLIGCGAIGSVIVDAVRREKFGTIAVLYDRISEKAKRIAGNAKVASSFEEFIDVDVDVVVEAASQEAVDEYAVSVLEKTDLMVMSAGAFARQNLIERIEEVARENKRRVYLPSGAVSGLDALKSVSGIADEVVLTTVKNPDALSNSPFFEIRRIKPEDIKDRTTLFTGTAREAVKLFPQNVNVAAAVSLAGIGFDRTLVKVVAEPGLNMNIHELRVKGDFGEFVAVTKNFPFPENPKTSYIAALSAVRTLKKIGERIVVGT